MPQIINSNIASLTAQRNLNMSQSSLNTSLERLSSGMRINSAKDDAAGLAISERMTSQIRGLNQASRNANDGISLAQTAEGAMGEIGNNLQRIRELAIQSANATNSASDRASLQAEVTQLTSEITRVASSTQFNGLNLLDGSFSSQSFQVGASANQTIDIAQISDARSTALGNNTLVMSGTKIDMPIAGTVANTAPAQTITADATVLLSTNLGSTATGDISIAATDSAETIANKINNAAANIGITAKAETSATLGTISAAGSVAFSLNGTLVTGSVSDTSDLTDLAAAINGRQGTTGITASFATAGDKSEITLTDKTGADVTLTGFTNSAGGTAVVDASSGAAAAVTLTSGAATDSARLVGNVTLSTADGQIAVANQAGAGELFDVSTSTFNALSTVDISTADGSQTAIDIVDAALSQVNSNRGSLGAVQNRFISTIANLQTTSENLSAARSRIQDADFATETANMTRGQILQQAGVAILAQANSLPNNVLSLLR